MSEEEQQEKVLCDYIGPDSKMELVQVPHKEHGSTFHLREVVGGASEIIVFDVHICSEQVALRLREWLERISRG